MSRRCVIIGGAKISRYDLISGYLRPGDFNIYCDCGLKHRQSLGAVPDLIVGDFDSYPAPAELMATGMSKTAAKCSEDKADDLQIIALPVKKMIQTRFSLQRKPCAGALTISCSLG